MEQRIYDNTKLINVLQSKYEVLQSVVKGNGSNGHEQRIKKLEDHCEPDNCFGLKALNKYLKEQEEMNMRKRTFRLADIANIIQLAVLALLVWQAFGG